MNATEIKTNHTKYNLQSWSKQKGLNPIAVEKGEGIYFWDYDGSRYTDMSSQLVNLNVGYGRTVFFYPETGIMEIRAASMGNKQL